MVLKSTPPTTQDILRDIQSLLTPPTTPGRDTEPSTESGSNIDFDTESSSSVFGGGWDIAQQLRINTSPRKPISMFEPGDLAGLEEYCTPRTSDPEPDIELDAEVPDESVDDKPDLARLEKYLTPRTSDPELDTELDTEVPDESEDDEPGNVLDRLEEYLTPRTSPQEFSFGLDDNADVESVDPDDQSETDDESDEELGVKADLEPLELDANSKSDDEPDNGVNVLDALAEYVTYEGRPRRPSWSDLTRSGTWTISGDRAGDEVSPAAEFLPEARNELEATRIRGGFRPLKRARKLDDDEHGVESLLIGHFNGHEVIHIVSKIERFLNDAETKTSVGRRFLPGEPNKLFLDDTTPDVQSAGIEPPVQKTGGGRWKQFIEIKQSPVGGKGIFAVKDLKRGDVVLVERPMLKTSSFTLMTDFRALDDEQKQIYMNLTAVEDANTNEIERIKRANGFQLHGGIGIFAIAARFNHGCGEKRNVKYFHDTRRDVMSFVVCHNVVLAGAELLVTYGGTPASLFRTFGFRCNCGGCEGLSDLDIRKLRAEEVGSVVYW